MIQHGVRPVVRATVLSRIRYEWTLADLAIWFAGAVTVPIHETSSAQRVRWILEGSADGWRAPRLVGDRAANGRLTPQLISPG